MYKLEIDDLSLEEYVFLKGFLLDGIESGEIPYPLQDCITVYRLKEYEDKWRLATPHWIEIQ